MEHSTSAVNWQPRNVAKRPGEMARNDFSHLARGADAILFFQWRASRSGAEKFHSAMLPHAGTSSRVWREVCALGADLARVGELRGSRVRADVAILWDWESHWAQDLDWRPSIDLDPRERVRAFYDRLWLDGVTADFAHPSADLSGYRLVVAPSSYLLSVQQGQNLARYVADGGTLLVSCFAAVVDQNDTVHLGGYGAPLREALGLTVEEFLPLREGSNVAVGLAGTTVTGDVWAEDLALEGASVVATYHDGPAAGRPAITRHEHGAGTGWYVSTRLDAAALAPLLAAVYADAATAPAALPDGVEVVRRQADDAEYMIAINHGPESVAIPAQGTSLLTDERVDGSITLPGGAVAVVRGSRQVPPGPHSLPEPRGLEGQ
jgi:beta-galactosidase